MLTCRIDLPPPVAMRSAARQHYGRDAAYYSTYWKSVETCRVLEITGGGDGGVLHPLLRPAAMKTHSRFLLFASFAVMLVGWACSEAESESLLGYPTSGPTYLSSGHLDVPLTFEGLVAEADLIAVVEPVAKVDEVWNVTETFVSSRFNARVVEVLKGEVEPASEILLYAPGGQVRTHSKLPPAVGRSKMRHRAWTSTWIGRSSFRSSRNSCSSNS